VIVRFLDLGVIGDHQLSLSKLSFHKEINLYFKDILLIPILTIKNLYV